MRTCEVRWKVGSFMTFGPRTTVKCKCPAMMTVFEEGYKRGREGKMDMCDEHYAAFLQQDKLPHSVKRFPSRIRKVKGDK